MSPLLQDFSEPSVCWCASGISMGLLDRLGRSSKLPSSQSPSSGGTSALSQPEARPALWTPHSSPISSLRALPGELGKVRPKGSLWLGVSAHPLGQCIHCR